MLTLMVGQENEIGIQYLDRFLTDN